MKSNNTDIFSPKLLHIILHISKNAFLIKLHVREKTSVDFVNEFKICLRFKLCM